MDNPINESYDILLSICRSEGISLTARYKQMRDLLERVCRNHIEDRSLQMTDLAARISYLAAKARLDLYEQNRLHTFRLTANAVLNRQEEANTENLFRDVKTIALFIQKLTGTDIPKELFTYLPGIDITFITTPPVKQKIKRMRVCYQHSDDRYLYVLPCDTISHEPIRVRYNVPGGNEEFAHTCNLLWPYAQLNLLDADMDDKGIITPSIIVLEPDYLIDISALAECFKEYGNHPANYIFSKLSPVESAGPLLLGNIANLFLDEWIHATDEVDYKNCMQKAFKRYYLELATCPDLQDPQKERQFFTDCKLHFDNIRQVVKNTFPSSGYELDKTDAVMEPAYICEPLGLQGRLDYLQRDLSAFIEMKSGKADEYTIRDRIAPKTNHRIQMLLYQAVLHYSLGIDQEKVKPYLLYTRYPLLYPALSSGEAIRKAIDLRNRIIADEYGIQLHNNITYTAGKLNEIHPDTLNEARLKGRLWENYIRPSIDMFTTRLHALSPLEKSYFYSIYNFLTKEQYTAKSGDIDYDGRAGAASLWLSTLTEKCEAGEILFDLELSVNHAASEEHAYVVFNRRPPVEATEGIIEALPNFRQSDAVVFYERNADTDNVTNKMVFKGGIEEITETSITVRLRAAQQNSSVLPADSLYALEHDTMDSLFRTQFQGLTVFASANKERRDLLLGQRMPTVDYSYLKGDNVTDDIDRVVRKACAATDYFLLIGPPGTGKTSQALRRMVESLHADSNNQILLLAYTNRAVDEICKALSRINNPPEYIRIGNELTCDPDYHHRLIGNILTDCTRRSDVTDRIRKSRIVVGTVATLSNRTELFRLKRFDVAIIDEATQILEPQLLNLLCGRTPSGENAIGKFILIGDHKQLPAVVLQHAEQTEIQDEKLREIGLLNLRDSLFERLYRTIRYLDSKTENTNISEYVIDQLTRQGRMHPEVARFPNQAFYGNTLQTLGLPHQVSGLDEISGHLPDDNWKEYLKQRVSFIPSQPEVMATSGKMNRSEAYIVSQLASRIYDQYGKDFDPNHTLGIITPYRSQIALIRQELTKSGITAFRDVLIDTVERFQGSERDVIIYSFCVNQAYQLEFLSNEIEENGMSIDRKLNVALTRARKQMFITGVPELLRLNPIYQNLLILITQ